MMLARYDSGSAKTKPAQPSLAAPIPPGAQISRSSIAGDGVSALCRTRHLLRREPVAIDRSHIDEPRVVRRCIRRRMVADRREPALQILARGTGLELPLERVDSDFGVRLRAIRVIQP